MNTKCCIRCNIIKNIQLFSKDNRQEDGFRNVCKDCRNSKNRLKNFKPDLKLTHKLCLKCKQTLSIDNFNLDRTKVDGYVKYCKSCRSVSNKISYIQHSQIKKKKSSDYYYNNKNKIRVATRARNKVRTKNDPFYCMKRRLRNRLYYALLNKNWKKNTRFTKYIGCSREELLKHIESQFLPGMSWDNQSTWHIDHIIPLSSAKTLDEMEKLCHYSNLRPLWAKDNIIKGSKLFATKKDYIVKQINFKEAKELVIKYHYSEKLPPSSYYFGLFCKKELVGVCTFALPTSPHYRTMLNIDKGQTILELNRLALKYNIKNEASLLISRCLKTFDKNTIIISYADTEKLHDGIIYQAANFKYYGLTEKRKEYYIKGMHSKTIADLGLDAPYRNRPQKHRYIYCLNGNYTDIKYKQAPYPKQISR